MKTAALTTLLILVALSGVAQKAEENLVRKSFTGYKTAILDDKGEEAVAFVDSRTVAYYGKMLNLVRTADSITVSELPLLDKFMVLAIRHRMDAEELQSTDGKGLLVKAIRNGMVGKSSVANVSVGDVTVEGDFAKGQLMANGKKAPFSFHFYKEENSWKIDLTSLFPMTATMFQNMLDESDMEENEFLLHLLEMGSGMAPSPDVWKPAQGQASH